MTAITPLGLKIGVRNDRFNTIWSKSRTVLYSAPCTIIKLKMKFRKFCNNDLFACNLNYYHQKYTYIKVIIIILS